ncbi:MAG: 50S ribosomal protein L29 [bacterium]
MKKNDIQKLKGKNVNELRKDLIKTRESLVPLLFEKVNGKIKNVQLIREAKKKIARMETFITLKENE